MTEPGKIPLLEARNLRLGYRIGREKTRVVLENINLKLFPGRVVAVIGPNGAGKTTLFKTLAGELEPMAGLVLLDGTQDIRHLSARQKAQRISRVLQNEQAAWPISVRDYVETGLFAADGWFGTVPAASRIRVEESLETMDLAALAGRSVTELSGGEFRRVVIARALVQDTDVLILDEPTADLDLANQLDTLALLKALARRGKAVAFSVHDLNLAALVADEMILVDSGKIAAKGSPGEVLTPDIIKSAYGVQAIIQPRPDCGIPHVIPAPSWLKERP
jgi:iron complex transport system ATP-binding protein